jgi:sulfur carrier protein
MIKYFITGAGVMKVIVNNSEVDVPEGISLNDLLQIKGYKSFERVAVWINGKQLLIKEFEQMTIKLGDKITIIRPIAGG